LTSKGLLLRCYVKGEKWFRRRLNYFVGGAATK
jgi:hypothetical protein